MTPRPDVEIVAAVRARRLRFREQPHVTLRGGTVASRRTRLPRPVRPGVLYRRIRAATRVASRL
jgi:hypothetical protein